MATSLRQLLFVAAVITCISLTFLNLFPDTNRNIFHTNTNEEPSPPPPHLLKPTQPMIPNPPYPPYPDLDLEPTGRLQSLNLGRSNTVMCWPSVGGVIAAEFVHSVELDFLGLDRFKAVNRSSDPVAEDAFCRKLRLAGGKWWVSYWDFLEATQSGGRSDGRKNSAEEDEVLYLGWPEKGGVWVIRLPNRNYFWTSFDRHRNAHTNAERCRALEMSGATFFAEPRECGFVRPLMEGFGEWKVEVGGGRGFGGEGESEGGDEI